MKDSFTSKYEGKGFRKEKEEKNGLKREVVLGLGFLNIS